jgi:hypothetical protein
LQGKKKEKEKEVSVKSLHFDLSHTIFELGCLENEITNILDREVGMRTRLDCGEFASIEKHKNNIKALKSAQKLLKEYRKKKFDY